MTPSPTLPWTETVLHHFGNGTDGGDPQAELVFDSAGNLYGTTQFGGASGGFENGGTVYRLSPGSAGWTETVLYSFPLSCSGPDGDLPAGTVVIDKAGNLYGVTQAGGFYGYGAVYELTPSSDGSYRERIIHSFNLTDGSLPAICMARLCSAATRTFVSLLVVAPSSDCREIRTRPGLKPC